MLKRNLIKKALNKVLLRTGLPHFGSRMAGAILAQASLRQSSRKARRYVFQPMSKFTAISLVILACIGQVLASTTVSNEDFYGVWSTSSSTLFPSRQILELSSEGGRWIQKNDLGEDRILLLDKTDISIDSDLLVVRFQKPGNKFGFKLVLGGWAIGNKKNIFGTVYMYENRGSGLTLYNGIPMHFASGIEQMPPQVFWSFFLESGPKRVNSGYITELASDLDNVAGIQTTDTPSTREYTLERISYTVSITKTDHPAHPAAIGIRKSPNDPAVVETAAKYEGEENLFKKHYNNYLETIEKQRQEARKYVEGLVERARAGELSN